MGFPLSRLIIAIILVNIIGTVIRWKIEDMKEHKEEGDK